MTSSPGRVLRTAGILLRIVLGLVFVYAAWVKLFGMHWPPRLEPWELFALAINSYGVLPLKAVELVARTLPWIELAIGLMLLLGRGLRISAPATSLLLLVFFGLMVRAFAQGKEISCGCFGPGEVISAWTLLRDGSMLAGALLLTWIAFRRQRQMA
ncbi:MAG TPA: MauE/DoxX family redox-associated membrane protein [Bryobacteraceae bacterium]|nr:MauE/DoxX family redox-associated membrane protein [Bryobacteraceae bacterium]